MSSILKTKKFCFTLSPKTNPDNCEYSFLPQASNISLLLSEPISSGYSLSSALFIEPSFKSISIFQFFESIS